MKAILGTRGAHKCEMAKLGVPVAPGFCITPKCLQRDDNDGGSALLGGARSDIKLALSELENMSERRFGNVVEPLLLSIQGELQTGVQGFEGTIENIGLNDAIAQAWAATSNPRFVWDSYRRLISTYSRAVRQLDMQPFEQELTLVKDRLNARDGLGRVHADCYIPTHELRELVVRYKEIFEEQTGEPFPQEPEKQLLEAVHAASCAWDRASGDCPNPVTVQSTIFSNYDFKSAVGMILGSDETADDADSCSAMVRGKWLVNAQSADMGGDRAPQQITQEASYQWAEEQGISESERLDEFPSLEEAMPGIFTQLLRCQDIVETHFPGAPGLEFAIHQGQLWVLQARTGQPTVSALSEVMHPVESIAEQSSDVPPAIAASSEAQLDFSDDLQLDLSGCFLSLILGQSPEDPAPEPASFIEEDESTCASNLSSSLSDHDSDNQEAEASAGLVPRGCKTRLVQSGRPTTSLFWQALKRFRRSRKVNRPATVAVHGAKSQASAAAAAQWLLATPCGLALWQTGLAGGAAAVACRALGFSIQHLGAASQVTPGLANMLSVARTTASCPQVLRSFVSPAGPIRALPFGMVCCTAYTNLCHATPAEDSQNALAPAWRLGCATFAVSMATVLTQKPAIQGASFTGPFGRQWPTLSKMVPTLALEMCVIDLVKKSLVGQGHEVTPGVLVASGVIAGTVAQTVMHPLSNLSAHAQVPLIGTPAPTASIALSLAAKAGPSMLFSGLGAACLRSVPLVATNSLVRVGMTTHFLGLASSNANA